MENENKNTANGRYKVELWLYDLSKGVSRAISELVLFKHFEGIWHSSIVVYGKEHYIAGDIVVDEPGRSQYGKAKNKIVLGYTDIPEVVFHQFIAQIVDEHTDQNYDLFKNNCNHFSDKCSLFLLEKNIPSYVIDLPSDIMKTPTGKVIGHLVKNVRPEEITKGAKKIKKFFNKLKL